MNLRQRRHPSAVRKRRLSAAPSHAAVTEERRTLAKITENNPGRLVMARAWLALAEQTEKNSETRTVYETLEPRQLAAQQQQAQSDDPAEPK